jgi:hypothetical protein
VELRLRLSYDALVALVEAEELVFSVPDSADTVSLALDEAAAEQLRSRLTAWMLAHVPTEGGRH